MRLGPLAAAAVVMALASCDTDRRAISRDDLPEVPEEADVVVAVDDAGFDADDLAVSVDDLIEFVISTEVRITATSSEVDLIDTGVLFPGESTFLILDRPGTYEVRTDPGDDVLVITAAGPDGSGG